MTDLAAIAARLDDAARHASAVSQLAEPLSLDDAYRVQSLSLVRRYARGERRVGVKMGFTSYAKMAQMGIDEVIWGRLTNAMVVDNGSKIERARFVHPRVEPEIAFRLKAVPDPRGSREELLTAVDGVAAALEIIDSRYEAFRFSLTDVVADNSSSSAFVVGDWRAPDGDLAQERLDLLIDGIVRQSGTGAAILGDPVRSLQEAVRLAAAAGEPLAPGDIVLAGGATAAEALTPGCRVELLTSTLNTAGFSVGD